MGNFLLPFEKPIVELQEKLEELRHFSETQDIDVTSEIRRMEEKIGETRRQIYRNLTPWQNVQVARHPNRPYPMDYIRAMTTDFTELHGDRQYKDDRAIIGGFARLGSRSVMVIATQKGRDTKSNLECNFGCAYPEGYRKALRLMKLADKFHTPILTFIDTPGAYPGIESEERHIAEAIAVNLREMFTMRVPIIVTITGEGGSGGALGIGVGDRILILEHAYYSVISPEGCAAILWRDRSHADKASAALKLTAADLYEGGMADRVVAEPEGGAHTDPKTMSETLRAILEEDLEDVLRIDADERLNRRYDKFRVMGVFNETPPESEPVPENGDQPQEESDKIPEETNEKG